MKVKMLETYQGVGDTATHLHDGFRVSILEAGESYTVDQKLGEYLLQHRKAEEISALVHYGAQEQPELRRDDVKYEQMKAEADLEPLISPEPEDESIMTTKSAPKRSKRSK